MSPRRDMLSPLTSPNGAENAMRGMMRSLRDALRAPVRATVIARPVKKAVPGPTPAVAVIDIFYPGYIYRIASDTWETLANSGDEFLPGTPVAGIIGETLYRNPSDFSLWRSDDRGATWTAVLASGNFSLDGDSSIDFGVAPDGTWWGLNDASPSKVYSSTDADTWVESYEFSGIIGGGDMGSLAVCPTDSNRVAALGFDGGNCYVVVSTDAGATWGSEVVVSADCRNGALMAWYGATQLVVLIDEPEAGDLERQKIYVSDDDGATWSSPLTNTTDLTLSNSNRLLYTKTYENGVLVLATDQKAFRTTDGAAFSTINPPLGAGGLPRISGIVLVGGVLWTLTNDGSWYREAAAKTSPPVAPESGYHTTPLVQI